MNKLVGVVILLFIGVVFGQTLSCNSAPGNILLENADGGDIVVNGASNDPGNPTSTYAFLTGPSPRYISSITENSPVPNCVGSNPACVEYFEVEFLEDDEAIPTTENTDPQSVTLLFRCFDTAPTGGWTVFLPGGSSQTFSCTTATTIRLVTLNSPDVAKNQVIGVRHNLGNSANYKLQFCEDNTENSVKVAGDPHFTGFAGQKFEFTGEHNKSYNLYSDELFAVSATLKKTYDGLGTVMNSFSVHLGSKYLISWNLNVPQEILNEWTSTLNNSKSLTATLKTIEVTINGVATILSKDYAVTLGCAKIFWNTRDLTITYGSYVTEIVLRFSKIGHELSPPMAYLDLSKFAIATSEASHVEGGILGRTLDATFPGEKLSKLVANDFVLTSPTDLSCKACSVPRKFQCEISPKSVLAHANLVNRR